MLTPTPSPARSVAGASRSRRGQTDKLRRFKRTAGVTRTVTRDDLTLFQLLDAVRLADSRQLKLYLAPTAHPKAFSRRLQRLYHAGYLDRPRAQLARRFLDDAPGSKPYVYALAADGYRELWRAAHGDTQRAPNPTRKNGEIQARGIEHRLAVTEAVLTLTLAASAEDWQLDSAEGEDLAHVAPDLPHKVAVPEHKGSATVPLYPDALLTLTADGQRFVYFLEADRGTEPITAGHWQRTSIRRKLAAYWTLHTHQLAPSLGAWRVLTVTTTAARVESMRALARSLDPKGKGSRLFLFTTASNVTLDEPARALTAPVWLTPREDDEAVRLAD